MINKISNLKLILGLAALVLAYLAVVYFDSSKSAPLDKQLISIDTSQITQIVITGSQEEVSLSKASGQWQVALPSGKKVTALANKVNSLMDKLLDIRTDRLAAKDESKWSDYQVDSTGTFLKVHEGDHISLDMIIGQLGANSYIRLAGETEVYASDNFTGLSASENLNHFRDNTFVKMETDSIESISFVYPGDSSFQITNNQGQWLIDEGIYADSTLMVDYLKNFKLKQNDNFALQDGSSVGSKLAEIAVLSQNQPQVILTAYQDLADSVVYQSSINTEAYFKDPALGKDVFVGKGQFLSNPEP